MPPVLHLSWLPDPAAWPSIAGKLRQMAKRAEGTGVEICAFTERDEIGGGVRRLPIPGGILSRLRRARAITAVLASRPDTRAILRWPGALDPGMGELMRRHGRNLVTEHHTDEGAELQLLARSPWLLARSTAERWRGPRLLAQAAGIVGVTDELRSRLCAASGAARSTVIANGVAVDAVPASGYRPFVGETLDVVFSCARFWPWQGLDRLLTGLSTHRGAPRIVLHLLGDTGDLAEQIERCRSSCFEVLCHGMVDSAQADAIYRQAHLAVSTLALHRKGMREACPLKSREYCARGLPFVHAYIDPDLPADLPWAQPLPMGDAPIDPEVLISATVRAQAVDAQSIRRWAANHLDWSAKLTALHRFTMEATA